MPLGAFIAPSKEALACGGKRAICLCTHLMGKERPKVQSTVAKRAASTHKEESAASSPHFLSAAGFVSHEVKITPHHLPSKVLYRIFVDRSREPVPKA